MFNFIDTQTKFYTKKAVEIEVKRLELVTAGTGLRSKNIGRIFKNATKILEIIFRINVLHNKKPPFIDRGGYNCRHKMQSINYLSKNEYTHGRR